MSLEEKYGSFDLKDIIHYDEVEREHFAKVIYETYKYNILKVNGKKVMGQGFFKRLSDKEKNDISWLRLYITQDEQNGITRIEGFGHRNAIFPLEMWVREMFDQGRVVSYSGSDGVRRSDDDYGVFSDKPKEHPEMKSFYEEKKRRLQILKEGGKLELPEYRREEEKERTK